MQHSLRGWLAGLLISASTHALATDVIFDTDMAIDDWSALLLLAKHPEVNLLAVTANGVGETHCEPALKNIPALLDLAGAGDVAVACGDDYPMDGYFVFPDAWREQADTLSGVSVPESEREVDDGHAVDMIHHKLIEAKDPVVIIATGSLTNIAQWLEQYPKDKSKVSRLVIMGGAFNVPGNIIVPGFTDNHPNTQSEWNMYVDGVAAQKVFAAGLPIEVVGLDVTNHVKVTKEFAQEFKQSVKTPAAKFWDAVLDDNDWFIDSGEYYFWDVLAALVVIDPKFCQGKMSPVSVTVKPSVQPGPWTNKDIPSTTKSGAKRNHYNPANFGATRMGGDNPPVKVCLKTDAARAFNVFTRTLNLP